MKYVLDMRWYTATAANTANNDAPSCEMTVKPDIERALNLVRDEGSSVS